MAYDDYAAQVERQKRRRQLAQAMMQGGGDRIDQVGGVAVPYSMGEGLAQMGRAIAGKFAMDRADKEEKDIRAKRAEDVAAVIFGCVASSTAALFCSMSRWRSPAVGVRIGVADGAPPSGMIRPA